MFSIARRISDIIQSAESKNIFDIHFDPMGTECKIRFRQDGVLRTVDSFPIALYPAVIARLKRGVPRFLVSAIPVFDCEKIILTFQNSPKKSSLEDMGFRAEHMAGIRKMLGNDGICIVSGPIGSGKSTTIDMISRILKKDFGGVTELAANSNFRDVGNVQTRGIVMHNVRSAEAIACVVHAGLSGHAIVVEMNQPIDVDQHIRENIVSGSIYQKFIRTLCSDCKVRDTNDTKFFMSRGCASCNHSGYVGRMPILEMSDPHTPTMKEDALIRAHDGQTSLAEVLRVCYG